RPPQPTGRRKKPPPPTRPSAGRPVTRRAPPSCQTPARAERRRAPQPPPTHAPEQKIERHPEELGAKRRASRRMATSAELISILRDGRAQARALLRMTLSLFGPSQIKAKSLRG